MSIAIPGTVKVTELLGVLSENSSDESDSADELFAQLRRSTDPALNWQVSETDNFDLIDHIMRDEADKVSQIWTTFTGLPVY